MEKIKSRIGKSKHIKPSQTSKVASLHREFADHPSRGLTPSKLARIMNDAEQGDLIAQCDLFEDIEEKDGHVMAELGKRKRALLGLDYSVQPAINASSEEEKTAELIDSIVQEIPDFEDIILGMAESIGYGYSCLEIEWLYTDYWRPVAVHLRPHRWFTIDPEKRNELRLRDNGTQYGQELNKFGWIHHIHKAKSGDVTRNGLFRALAWPFLFKSRSVNDLAEFLEIYGLPVRVGKYPPGADEEKQDMLLRALVSMGHNAAGIIEEGMDIEFMEAAKGQSDPYKAMIEWCEKTQSKAILGGTLTSQADGASSTNALGNVHNEVRRDLMEADAKQIASTLSRDLVKAICTLNGFCLNGERHPRFVFDTKDVEDLHLFAESIPKLVESGVQIPLHYANDKLGIPVPEEGEAVLKSVAQQQQPSEALAALAAERSKFTPDQQIIEDLGDKLDLKSPINSELIATAIRASTSPEDLENRLAIVLKEASLSAFTDQLEKALFAADVMGYANAD